MPRRCLRIHAYTAAVFNALAGSNRGGENLGLARPANTRIVWLAVLQRFQCDQISETAVFSSAGIGADAEEADND